MGADGELAASSKVFCPACGKGRVPGERARSGKANLASAQTGRSRNIRSLMFPSSPSRCRGTATNASNDTIQSFLIECPLQLSPSAKHSQSSVSLMSFYLPGHACPTRLVSLISYSVAAAAPTSFVHITYKQASSFIWALPTRLQLQRLPGRRPLPIRSRHSLVL